MKGKSRKRGYATPLPREVGETGGEGEIKEKPRGGVAPYEVCLGDQEIEEKLRGAIAPRGLSQESDRSRVRTSPEAYSPYSNSACDGETRRYINNDGKR